MTINAHPELPDFDYIRPATLEEASRFLEAHAGEARPLLGGTDIFVRMRDGFWHDKYLVDVKNLDGTDNLHFDPTAGLTIGAGVNMNRVMTMPEVQQVYPVLAEACRSVASSQLRTRATIVGNLCNASPAGDTIGACMLYDGVLKVYGVDAFLSRLVAPPRALEGVAYTGRRAGVLVGPSGEHIELIESPPAPGAATGGP